MFLYVIKTRSMFLMWMNFSLLLTSKTRLILKIASQQTHKMVRFCSSPKNSQQLFNRVWLYLAITLCVEPDVKYINIFSRDCVKVSYSCMSKMKFVIQGYNTWILSQPKTNHLPSQNKSNCWKKEECPIPRIVLVWNIIYKYIYIWRWLAAW